MPDRIAGHLVRWGARVAGIGLTVLGLLMGGSETAQAQPTVLGTDVYTGSYVTYDLTDLGAFRQYRNTTSAGAGANAREWQFTQGTSGTPDYTNKWMPYNNASTRYQIAGYNQLIAPNTAFPPTTGTATYAGGAGWPGGLPATTTGNYYTFNITESAPTANNTMAVLETTYNPVAITAVSTPSAPSYGQAATVTATTAATPDAAEYLWLRYSTDNFATSSLLLMSGSGTSWSAAVPGQVGGTVVRYYVLSSPLNSGVSSTNADMLTLRLNNNAGANYSYTVAATMCGTYSVNPAGGGLPNFTTMGTAFAALNAAGVSCAVTMNVKDGATFAEQNLQLNTISGASSTNTITFQRDNSTGTKPKVEPSSGFASGGTLDAIIKLSGSDFVTFDGIDVAENPANTGANQMEYGYALFHASATNGAQDNQIRSCAITLDKANTNTTVGIYSASTTISGTAALPTSAAGANSRNKFNGNTIANAAKAMQFEGNTSNANLDLNNEIGTTTGNTMTNIGQSSGTAQMYGMQINGQSGVKIENNSLAINTGVTGSNNIRGISTGVNATAAFAGTVTINNNTITITNTGATTGNVFGIQHAATNNVTGVTITNNIVQNCSLVNTGTVSFIEDQSTGSVTVSINGNRILNNTAATAALVYGINRSGGSSTSITVGTSGVGNGNTIQNTTLTGAGSQFRGMVSNAAASFTNNLIDNTQQTGTGAPSFQGITLGPGAATLNANTITNNAVTSATGGTTVGWYGLISSASTTTQTLTSNIVTDNTVTGPNPISLWGIFMQGTGVITASLNVIGNLTAGTMTNTNAVNVRALVLGNGTSGNAASRNKIYGLTANGTNAVVAGINPFGGTGATTATNNLIGGLAAPQSTNANAVVAFRLENGWSGSFDNLYYNTVYLTGTSSGTGFGSSGVYTLATTISPNLRNNVIVNLTTPTGTAYAAAVRGFSGTQGTAPTAISSTSNNNLYYCGTPSAQKVIYLEGTSTITNVLPSLAAYQTLLATREQNSLTGPVTFSSTTGTATDFLHFTAASTQPVEGAAGTGTGITVDYDNDARSATTPDIGADEVALTTVDLTPPRINLNSVLPTTTGTLTGLTLSNVAITDASGVDVAAGTKPRLYYKLSTDPDTYNSNTSATTGWKYVEASNGSSPFSFTMDYSLLPVAITGNQTIQYFVTAQDLAATPNVGISVTTTGSNVHNVFAATPASVALTSAAFALGGTPLSYLIYTPFSGTINVGAGQTYTSLTRTGGLFEAMNTGALVGNLTIQITSDITNEDGTFELRPMVEFPSASNYTITMQSDAATVRLISGSITGGIRFNGIDRVTIDGRFGGSGKYLRFRNTLATASTLYFAQDANNITIRECFIEGAQNSYFQYAPVYLGQSTTTAVNGVAGGVTGNSNFQLLNSEISGRTDNSTFPQSLFVGYGTTNAANTNVTISGNNFVNFAQHAVHAGYGLVGSNWTVSNNSFYCTTTVSGSSSGAAQWVIAIYPNAAATNLIINGNYIGGNAPLAASGTLTNTTAATAANGWRGILITNSTVTSNFSQITNNVIRNISVTQTTARAIEVQAGAANTYLISGNSISNISCGGSNSTGRTAPQLVGIYSGSTAATAGTQTITANTISGLTLTNTGTNDLWLEGIWVNGTGSAGTIRRNRIYGLVNNNGLSNSGQTGVTINGGSWSVQNNQIALTNGSNTNAQIMYALLDQSASGQATSYYYNSTYLGGSNPSGTSGSANLGRSSSAGNSCTIRDNIFMNTRTGGSGDHNAMFINSSLTSVTSNNNALYATNAATVCNRQGTNYTFANWQTVNSQDAASVNVGAKFVDLSTGNLNLDGTTNCSLDGAGVVVAGVNGEFDNAATSRATTPDIGSDEFTYTQQTAVLASGPICSGATASVTLNGNGGPWSVTYTDGVTPVTVNNVAASPFTFTPAAGTYSVTSVTDAYGCALAPSGSLTVEALPTFGTAQTNVTCNGAGDGTITVTAAGGSGSYQFSKNNGGAWVSGSSPFVFSGLAPAAYQIKVRNATGAQCEAAAGATTVTITEPTAISATTTPTPTTCPGSNDGQLTVNASGGTGTLEYSINSTVTYQSSNVFTGLSAVNATIRVRDANGCVFTLVGQNPGSPTAFSVSPVATASTVCVGGTTTVTVTASGGTGTLEYSINNGASYQPSNVFTGVTSGSKLVRVRDANLCVSGATSVVIGTTTTTTWSGAVDSDWYNAGNWDFCVPSSGIDAVIPTGATVVIGTGTAAANDLDIQGTATLTVSGTGNLDVYGTFTTAGSGSFVATSGTTHFRGSGAQPVPAGSYNNVTLTGGTAKVLTGNVNLAGGLNLTAGMLRLANFDLTLADNQTITGFSNTHFVVEDGTGVLTFQSVGGGETVIFPIGTSTASANYTPAKLTNNGTADDFTGTVNNTIPQGPIVQPGGPHVVGKTWDISEAVAGGSNATLVLGWNTANEGAFFDRTLSAVSHFVGGVWDHPWIGWGPAVAGTFGSTWERSRSSLTSFSPFAMQDANMPLPVTLTQFEATRRGNDVALTWGTASERNSKGFEVQVSTAQNRGAASWRALGFVASETPNSNTARRYTFTDEEAGKAGVRYYRLKQVDLDGLTHFSPTRVVTFGPVSEPTIAVWPNPFAGEVTLELAATATGSVELTLTDALGRTVWQQTTPVTAGVQQLPLALPVSLRTGAYVLTATVNGQALRHSLIKQ